MKKRCFFFTLVIMVTSIFGSNHVQAVTNKPTEETIEKIDRFVEQQIQQKHIPGASLAIISESNTVFSKGYGVVDIKSNRPITTETTFNTGSMAKSMASTAILQLCEQGKIDLDDPVQKYIPEFHLANDQFTANITIRHLLTHTAGLGYQSQEAVYWGPEKFEQKTIVNVLKNLQSFQPLNEPGKAFNYSNVGYGLIGLIIKRVSGEPYPDYVKRHILQPLGMNHTAVIPQDYGNRVEAQQYIIEFTRLKPIVRPFEEWGNPAGLGWATTPSDWAEYAKAHLGTSKATILSDKSLREAHFNGVATPLGATYGYGWFHKKVNGLEVVFHQGGGSAAIALIPEKKLALVFMGNVLSTEVWNVGFGAASMLIGEEQGAIARFPDVFGALSIIWTAMTVISMPLLIWLILSIRTQMGNRGSRSNQSKRWVTITRVIFFGLLEVLLLGYLFFLNRDVSETPNFFGAVNGFYLDQFIGLTLSVCTVSLWTTYSVYQLVRSSKTKFRRSNYVSPHNF